jgi:hypothetical protein
MSVRRSSVKTVGFGMLKSYLFQTVRKLNAAMVSIGTVKN